MKVLTLLFGLFSFFVLQNSSCSNQKILKQELTSKEISILKEQPSFVQDELIRIYNENGSLDDVNVIQSTQNGKPVYYIGGQGEHLLLNNKGNTVNVASITLARELEKNSKVLLGNADDTIGKEVVTFQTPIKKPMKPQLEEIDVRDLTIADKNISKERLRQLDALASDKLKAKFRTFKPQNKNSQMAQIFAFDAKDGDTYFMFDEGMALDRPAYVLNAKGDTVCVTGGMRRMPNPEAKPCPKEVEGSRVILWNN